jgi:RNA polymerase sigma factor (TIGR02999 family)
MWQSEGVMNEITQLLNAIHEGQPEAAGRLMPLLFNELRALAARLLANERPGQTLTATALVHEAYLRLVGPSREQGWEGRRHFFSAAADAMRRILVENARRKGSQKRGGDFRRQELCPDEVTLPEVSEDVLALDEALEKLRATDPQAGELVRLRYFAGLTIKEAAEVMGVSPRTADARWAYARAWLLAELQADEP